VVTEGSLLEISLTTERNMTDIEYVRTATRLSDRDYERLILYCAKLQPEERVAVHRLHTKVSQKRCR
jgi:hypothetical protein